MTKLVLYYYNYNPIVQNYHIKDIPLLEHTTTHIAYGHWDIINCEPLSTNAWIDYEQKFTNKDTGITPLDTYQPLDSERDSFFGNFGQFKKLIDKGHRIKVYLIIRFININSFSTKDNIIKTICNILSILRRFPIFSGIIFKLYDPTYYIKNYIQPIEEETVIHKNNLFVFLDFLTQLRLALNNNGLLHFLLNICTYGLNPTILLQLQPHINEFHIKTFNICIDKTHSHFHTDPTMCKNIIQEYINHRIDNHKLFIAGSTHANTFHKTDGIYEKAIFDSNTVKYTHLPLAECLEYNDPSTHGVYSYHHGIKDLYTYDNEVSVKEKCKIVLNNQLGGITLHEIASDKPYSNPRSLTYSIHHYLSTHSPTY